MFIFCLNGFFIFFHDFQNTQSEDFDFPAMIQAGWTCLKPVLVFRSKANCLFHFVLAKGDFAFGSTRVLLESMCRAGRNSLRFAKKLHIDGLENSPDMERDIGFHSFHHCTIQSYVFILQFRSYCCGLTAAFCMYMCKAPGGLSRAYCKLCKLLSSKQNAGE